MRSSTQLTVAIQLDRSANRPMHEQLADQLARAIDTGVLAKGTRVPSTRALSGMLDVSRGVSLAAYDILFAKGYIEGRHGSGSYVCGRPVSLFADRRAHTAAHSAVHTAVHAAAHGAVHLVAHGVVQTAVHPATRPAAGRHDAHAGPTTKQPRRQIDLSPGHPSAQDFPLEAWRAAWRQASFQPPPIGDLPPLGLPTLRRAVAEHLLLTRGLKLAEHQVMITTGVAHGLRLALDLIGEPDAPVALEDPCPRGLRALVSELRSTVVMPVDEHGARVNALTGRCRAAVVCPDAHEPLGVTLSADRRRSLAQWARATDGYVVEFGGDRVFRPTAGALPRMLDLAGDRTIVVGGFCGLFSPNLRLGYLVLPNELAQRLLATTGGPAADQASYVTQVAMTHLLEEGRVVRRMHQLGRICRNKRRLLVEALDGTVDGVHVAERHGFGSAVVHLPNRMDACAVSAVLRDRGVTVPSLRSFFQQDRPAANALVIGFAHLSDDELTAALDELEVALAAMAAKAS